MKRKVVILKNKSNTLLLISNTSALLVDCGYDYEDTNIIIDYLQSNIFRRTLWKKKSMNLLQLVLVLF